LLQNELKSLKANGSINGNNTTENNKDENENNNNNYNRIDNDKYEKLKKKYLETKQALNDFAETSKKEFSKN